MAIYHALIPPESRTNKNIIDTMEVYCPKTKAFEALLVLHITKYKKLR